MSLLCVFGHILEKSNFDTWYISQCSPEKESIECWGEDMGGCKEIYLRNWSIGDYGG